MAVSAAVDWPMLALLVAEAAVLGVLVIAPLRRRYDDSDTGHGNLVELPAPLPVTLRRSGAFIGIGFVVAVAMISLRNPSLADVYQSLVARLVGLVIHDPAAVDAYTNRLIVIVPLSVIAFVVAQAVCLRSTPGRKAMILLHAPLVLAAAAVGDALLGVVALAAGISLGPIPLLSIVIHFLIAYLFAMRLAMTSYQLPRPTQVPITRTRNLRDDVVLVSALVIDILLVTVSALLFLHWASDSALAFGVTLIVLPTYLKFGLYAILSTLALAGARPPQPGPERPLVTVIAPAYNEELNIAAWVAAIEVAAQRYGGPVEIILCDDGSTDETAERCWTALAACTFATGRVIRGTHGGKSAALNNALRQARSEIVIRHDSDCLMHPDAILYTVPWFLERPDVGLVGAFMLPKLPLRTWIDRMRTIELVTGFGLPRVGFAVIDSQPCVPGNYTAVRRGPALELGGWVSGMFGEDIDFTCNMARLGYRAVYDRRVWAFEDVPDSLYQLRLQRRRWNRGSLQNFARFIPLAAGSAGPRFWFSEFVRAARRLIMPLQFIGFAYVVALVFFDASVSLNLGRFLTYYVLAKLPIFLVTVLSLNFRRMGRVAWWYPLYFFFAFVKRFANLECMLGMPTRAVQVPLARVRPAASSPAVPAHRLAGIED